MVGLRVSVLGRLLAALAVSACLAACGQGGPTALDAANNYMYALSEGNYAGACALVAPGTQEALEPAHRRHTSCAELIEHCLPNSVTKAIHDQTQLLFATVQLTHDRGGWQAFVSGTPVAKAIRKFTVNEERGRWEVTSPGHAISRCRLKSPHHGRSSGGRHHGNGSGSR
jgi:hypothetical protein